MNMTCVSQLRSVQALTGILRSLWFLVFALLLLLPGAVAAQEPAVAEIIEREAADLCSKPHLPGTAEYTIEPGDLERRFLLHVPTGYDGRRRLPLVLDLHGSTSFPEQELALSGMVGLADAEGFAVVAPEGVGGFWNVPFDPEIQDDVQFIDDVIDRVDELLCIERSRVYATGFSGGGRMVSQLACLLPGRFAAIAPVGGLRFRAHCQDQVPAITFHGTADPVNPYDGGGPGYWQTGIEHAVQSWAAHNGCRAVPFEWQVSESATKARYLGCSHGNRVEFYRIEGMGQQWPGSPLDTGKETFGPPNGEIDATRLMWEFFRHHRLQ
jgi:polyhydroxybutyrate depolymerase